MKVGFLPGDLKIDLTGAGSSSAILSTAYNVVPIWLKIGHDSLKLAKLASTKIVDEWTEDSEKQKQMLLSELAPSMQVFVSCGIALDALYDTLRPYAKISREEIERWKERKTSREKQISEIIRRTHKLTPKHLNDFKKCICWIIKHRDLAVHPSTELQNACARPDIPVAVDWKFSTYRFENAKACLNNTINMLAYLWENPSADEQAASEISNIIKALIELNIIKPNP
jgi:signal transduction histidine kinase